MKLVTQMVAHIARVELFYVLNQKRKSFSEILLNFFNPMRTMPSALKYFLKILTVTVFVTSFISVQSYNNLHGIELGDMVEISFTRYIDGEFSYEYTDDFPLEVIVSYSEINAAVVDALLGMKEGDVKDISWDVDQLNGTINHFEYRNTKVVDITYDSTPDSQGIGRIVLIIFEVLLGIGVVIGGIYMFMKIRKRIRLKTCSNCSNTATSKCAKCGTHICSECFGKGCNVCGSKKFIRL